MEWVALGVWLFAVAMAVPAAGIPIPSLALQAPFALAGLGCLIAFLAGASTLFAWIAAGCAALGALVVSFGAHTLVEDGDNIGWIAPHRKEVCATLVGFELPFLLVAIVCTAYAAAVA